MKPIKDVFNILNKMYIKPMHLKNHANSQGTEESKHGTVPGLKGLAIQGLKEIFTE